MAIIRRAFALAMMGALAWAGPGTGPDAARAAMVTAQPDPDAAVAPFVFDTAKGSPSRGAN